MLLGPVPATLRIRRRPAVESGPRQLPIELPSHRKPNSIRVHLRIGKIGVDIVQHDDQATIILQHDRTPMRQFPALEQNPLAAPLMEP
jgi:hypothetical protein